MKIPWQAHQDPEVSVSLVRLEMVQSTRVGRLLTAHFWFLVGIHDARLIGDGPPQRDLRTPRTENTSVAAHSPVRTFFGRLNLIFVTSPGLLLHWVLEAMRAQTPWIFSHGQDSHMPSWCVWTVDLSTAPSSLSLSALFPQRPSCELFCFGRHDSLGLVMRYVNQLPPHECNMAIGFRKDCHQRRFCCAKAPFLAAAHYFLTDKSSNVPTKVPKSRIGGSGPTTLEQFSLGVEAPSQSSQEIELANFLLKRLYAMVMPFYSTFLLLLALALCRALGAATPGRRSGLGRLLGSGFAWVSVKPLQALGTVSHPAVSPLDWRPHPSLPKLGRGKHTKANRPRAGAWLPVLWMLGFLNLPVCVWSAPEGVAEIEQIAGAITQHRQQTSAEAGRFYPEPPDPFGETPALPRNNTPDIIHHRISPPRGPPPPQQFRTELQALRPQTTPVRTRDVSVTVWVGTPGFLPEVLTFDQGMPCDVDDLVFAVEQKLDRLRLPFCDRVLTVRPQPFFTCASMIVVPSWVAYASLAVVCLDLRDLRDEGQGPVMATYVTRPTCKAELCRQAGHYGRQLCEVYVGTSTEPLQDDESVHLASGCLVTFVRQDCCPHFALDLPYKLQFPEAWPVPPIPPQVPPLKALLLLHSRGRFLFRQQAGVLPIDEAAARFIGVERADIDIHAPADEQMEQAFYRGLGVRGVLVFVERNMLPPDRPQFVVFLDLRQIAESFQFLVLDHLFITHAELNALVLRQPPPGWRMRIRGGRMRRRGIEVQQGSTLVFGFEYAGGLNIRSPSFSPTTEESGGSDDEDDEESSEDDDPDSDATTRSRSCRRGNRRGARDPSSDHSYQDGFGGIDTFCLTPLQDTVLAEVGAAKVAHALAIAVINHIWVAHIVWALNLLIAGSTLDLVVMCAVRIQASAIYIGNALDTPDDRDCSQTVSCRRGITAVRSTSVTWTGKHAMSGQAVQQRLLEEPQCSGPTEQRVLDQLRFLAEELGGDWPYFGRGLGPIGPFQPALPSEDEDDVTFKWVAAIVLKWGYAIEALTVVLGFPTTSAEAIATVQAARHHEDAEHFPHLTPVEPQPLQGNIVLVAEPHWSPTNHLACFDTRACDGRFFVRPVPDYCTKQELLYFAAITNDVLEALAVFVGDSAEPLAEDGYAQLHKGVLIVVVPYGYVVRHREPLALYLLDSQVWSATHGFARGSVEGCYCVIYGAQSRLYRADLAQPLQYRARLAEFVGVRQQDLSLVPATPRVADASVDGQDCSTVLAVTTRTQLDQQPETVVALVDCRPILQGWRSVLCPRQLLDGHSLLRSLDEEAPLGWHTTLEGAPQRYGYFQVHAGQVLVADYARDRPVAEHVPRQLPLRDADFEQVSPGPLHDSPPQDPTPPTSWGEDVWGSDQGSPPSSPMISGTFYVFSQDYMPERVNIMLPAPANLWHTLQVVNELRDEDRCKDGPLLREVFPQPDMDFAVLLAIPQWSLPRIPVLFDTRIVDGRMFCKQVACHATRASLLLEAALAETGPYDVYLGDHPWPLAAQDNRTVEEGTLVVVVLNDQAPPVIASLPDMLQSAVGWSHDVWVQHPDLRSHLVYTDHRNLFLPVDGDAVSPSPRDLATNLGRTEQDLAISVATPALVAYARIGWHVHSVTAARIHAEDTAPAHDRAAVFLDLRQIWLGVQVVFCNIASFNVEDVLATFVPQCPSGFRICTQWERSAEPAAPVRAYPCDGAVLRVFYGRAEDDRPEQRLLPANSVTAEATSHSEAAPTDNSSGMLGSGNPTTETPPPASGPGHAGQPRARVARHSPAKCRALGPVERIVYSAVALIGFGCCLCRLITPFCANCLSSTLLQPLRWARWPYRHLSLCCPQLLGRLSGDANRHGTETPWKRRICSYSQ